MSPHGQCAEVLRRWLVLRPRPECLAAGPVLLAFPIVCPGQGPPQSAALQHK